MRVRTAVLRYGLAIALLSTEGWAQVAPVSAPAFEAVSVKPNRSTETMMSYHRPPSGFVATNMPLAFLILMAYDVRPEHIARAPGWIHSERFDVHATVGEQDREQFRKDRSTFRAMLRSLLADRFALSVIERPRDAQGYTLIVARPDGRLGSQLRVSTLTCEQQSTQCGLQSASGEVRGRGTSVSALANYLGLVLGTLVSDKTGLAGSYDFELGWAEDRRVPTAVDLAIPPQADGGSLFTAVVEQLGLRLQPTPIAQKSLVIEHVERPTAN